ncbi:inner membrane protein YiaA [Couchioplanes caeruleus]|uniref:Putative membrane protein YiaA n=1 Tax=Couchioplanes caeruleus TaxID=56438 RepID=A0A3N1GFI5_9ACTN|nr:inner membrane protein YiaA [Couchioplanes caeruleus]ROP28958.1 putative membrane protein YiaA [Couchioplanes caeruleus]
MTAQPSFSVKPTAAFVGASWAALFLGVLCYAVGLWNAEMTKSEKGFYASVLVLGLFAAVSLQKSVRDKAEGLPVSALYLGLSWATVGLGVVMLVVGLWNSGMLLSEKGFYGLAFVLTLFAAVAVQKNVRDMLLFRAPSHAASPAPTSYAVPPAAVTTTTTVTR